MGKMIQLEKEVEVMDVVKAVKEHLKISHGESSPPRHEKAFSLACNETDIGEGRVSIRDEQGPARKPNRVLDQSCRLSIGYFGPDT